MAPASLISARPGARSIAAWIASHPKALRERWLASLSPNAIAALPYLWEVWARTEHQRPPSHEDWLTWVVLGGRGAGKTRTGAEWVRLQVEGARPEDPGLCARIALVAETADQARDVMVLGESGLLAVAPPDRRPEFQVSRRRLVWPNGAEAQLFSASDPESLRGPQFDAAWSDELAKWRRAREAWDMLQFALRLGERPRQIVTTTPRRNPVLFEILDDARTVSTSAPTRANRANLAESFLEAVERRYGGSTLGRQELEGALLRDLEGGLWSRETLDAHRRSSPPPLGRVVVAVDPPAASHKGADACGIVVAGLVAEGGGEWFGEGDEAADRRAVILADLSVEGATPAAWAARAVGAYAQFGADRIVAEVNQGGEMVETVIRQIDPNVAYRAVRATRGKRLRAEPVAALYEQGRVAHVGRFDRLEDQMCAFSRDGARPLRAADGRSPDRVDALVWALTDLMLRAETAPQVRGL
ncbi:MAG: terminase family protein [Pseudomonadota bacterium]